MPIKQFNVDQIIGFEIHDARLSHFKWLPKMQKTFFFRLIKRNSWYSEGFYENGCREQCYESGCWEANAYTRKELEDLDYLVNSQNEVFCKPYVQVWLGPKMSTTKKFNTLDDAKNWVELLKRLSGKTFSEWPNLKKLKAAAAAFFI